MGSSLHGRIWGEEENPFTQDVENVPQLRSRGAQRLNVPKNVRLASSLTAALPEAILNILDMPDPWSVVRGNAQKKRVHLMRAVEASMGAGLDEMNEQPRKDHPASRASVIRRAQ